MPVLQTIQLLAETLYIIECILGWLYRSSIVHSTVFYLKKHIYFFVLFYLFQLNTEGVNCDRCKAGYFYLSETNDMGCQACFCMGESQQCSSAPHSWKMVRWSVYHISILALKYRISHKCQIQLFNNNGTICKLFDTNNTLFLILKKCNQPLCLEVGSTAECPFELKQEELPGF